MRCNSYYVNVFLLFAVVMVSLIFITGCSSSKSLKVVSSSMEPTIKNGEFVRVEKVNILDVKGGDIVVFDSEKGSVVARVVSLNNAAGTFTAKGDANIGIAVWEKDIPLSNIKWRVAKPQHTNNRTIDCESLPAQPVAGSLYEKDLCYAFSLASGKQIDCSRISLPTLKQYCLLKKSNGRSELNLELFAYCTGYGFKVDGITFDRSNFEVLSTKEDSSDANNLIIQFRDDLCNYFVCTNVTYYPCGAGRPSSITPYVRGE